MKKGSDGLLHLLTEHTYYAQVQGEMAILGVQWCDFVVYSNGMVVVDRSREEARTFLSLPCGTSVVIETDLHREIWEITM